MAKKRSLKKALFMALLSMIVCLSLFAGTTFAWFTDGVTSSNNVIKAGNLDIEMEYDNGNGWTPFTSSTNVFMKDALWEPGHTEVIKFKIRNAGSLALKYQLGMHVVSEVGSVNDNEEEFKLSDYIKYGVVDGAQTFANRNEAIGAVDANAKALNEAYNSEVAKLNSKEEKCITMVVYMPINVGDNVNAKNPDEAPSINLGIDLFATQAEAENDSFDNTYDKNFVIATNATVAQKALDEAEPYTTIKLAPGVNYGTLLIRPVDGAKNTVKDCDYLIYNKEMLRKVENLTIIGAPGATIEAIKVVSGHIEGSTGYVVDVKNLVIDSVEFTDTYINSSYSYASPIFFNLSYINVNGLTVKNCKLIGDNDKMNFVYFYGSKASNSTFETEAKNITITNNTVDGITRLCELREAENVTITSNTIKNMAQHAILLACNSGNNYSGNVTITGNYADGINERFVRMAGAGSTNVVVKDNVIRNYYGEDKDYIKVTDLNGGTFIDENNTISFAWNGTVPASMPESLVVNTTANTISINSVSAFAYLNTLVNDPEFYNNYGSKWKYTIELNTDVDLKNHVWTPILLSNFVAFEGNNHTISNINVDTTGDYAGLFADIRCNDIGVTYVRNLNIDGAYVKGNKDVGVLAGASTQGVIENVTINNATVIGNKYVGGVFGWGNGSVNDSTVKNSTITIPNGGEKEAGGLIGYLSNDGKASTVNNVIAGNTVENVTIIAPTIASGLVSQPNSSNSGGAVIEIVENTVKNVTIVASDNTASLYVSNNVSNKTLVKNNTAIDYKVGREVYGLKVLQIGGNTGTIVVESKEALLNLGKLKNEWVTLFSNGKGSEYSNYAPQNGGAGTDYYYNWNWTVELMTDIDFEGAEIAPIDLGKREVFDGHGHTIKNAIIKTDSTTKNEAGLFIANDCGVKNLKLDNIHVTGSNVGNSTAGVLAGSCNKVVENITITNSSVTGGKYTGGVIGYGYTKVFDCTVNNVVVKGGYKLGGLIGYICASETNTGDVTGNTLIDCTVDGIGGGVFAGGKDKYVVGKVVGNYNCNGICNDNTIINMTTSATQNIGEIEAGKVVTQ